jgi:hypothetical protein
MTPEEAWWLIEARSPKRMYGRLTEEEAEELYQEIMAEEEAQGVE